MAQAVFNALTHIGTVFGYVLVLAKIKFSKKSDDRAARNSDSLQVALYTHSKLAKTVLFQFLLVLKRLLLKLIELFLRLVNRGNLRHLSHFDSSFLMVVVFLV